MKFSLTAICFLAISFCYSQKSAITRHPSAFPINPNKFMGIGVFKIGCDSDVVKTATSEGRYITPMDNEDTYYHTVNANKTNVAVLFDVPVIVYRIAKNETTRNIFDNECPDIQKYFITEYVVDSIKIYDVMLTFYKNKLIEFDCDNTNPSIISAMQLKYGEPKLSKEKKSITCVYNLTGIKEAHNDIAYFETWYNGPIEAIKLTHKSYNDKCEIEYSGGLSYQITNKEFEAWKAKHRDDYLKPKGDKSALKNF